MDAPGLLFLFADPNGGDEGTDPDPGGAQIAYFIDLQTGIDLAGTAQNLIHLVGSNRVQSAAEGVKLDQIQIIPGLYITGRRIQAGVIHPLIHDPQRPLGFVEMGNAVFGQNRQTVAANQLRNPVVDFPVNVVGTACQDDPVGMMVFDPFKRFLRGNCPICRETPADVGKLGRVFWRL